MLGDPEISPRCGLRSPPGETQPWPKTTLPARSLPGVSQMLSSLPPDPEARGILGTLTLWTRLYQTLLPESAQGNGLPEPHFCNSACSPTQTGGSAQASGPRLASWSHPHSPLARASHRLTPPCLHHLTLGSPADPCSPWASGLHGHWLRWLPGWEASPWSPQTLG